MFCCGIMHERLRHVLSFSQKTFAKVHPFCVKTKDIYGFLTIFLFFRCSFSYVCCRFTDVLSVAIIRIERPMPLYYCHKCNFRCKSYQQHGQLCPAAYLYGFSHVFSCQLSFVVANVGFVEIFVEVGVASAEAAV